MGKRGLAGLCVVVIALLGAAVALGAGFHKAKALNTNNGIGYDSKVADFNGDGRPDILATVDSGDNDAVYLYRGKAGGGFKAPTKTTIASDAPEGVALGRFNGDKRLDAAISSYTDNSVYLLFGKKGGGFKKGPVLDAGPGAFNIAAADMNGDGLKDIVTGNYSNTSALGQAVSVLLQKKSGGFRNHVDYEGGDSILGMAIGRVNGDRSRDVVVQDSGGTISVLLGRKNGTLRNPKNSTHDSNGGYDNVALADFNGDGKTDIAAGEYTAGKVLVLLGKGDGTFRAPKSKTFSGPEGIAAGKFDGDHKMDLAVGDYSAEKVFVLHGRGDGTFKSKRQTLTSTDGSYSMTLAKLNHDKLTDIIDGTATSVDVFMGK